MQCEEGTEHHYRYITITVQHGGTNGVGGCEHCWPTAPDASQQLVHLCPHGLFTKWPKVYELPNHEAETEAGVFVNEFFTRFGVPAELHLDQGCKFESRVFWEWCKLLGLHKTRTMTLHPQSDGVVEQYNQMLAQQLAKY